MYKEGLQSFLYKVFKIDCRRVILQKFLGFNRKVWITSQ